MHTYSNVCNTHAHMYTFTVGVFIYIVPINTVITRNSANPKC